MKIKDWISLIRVHQYVKNLFILAPLLFSQQYLEVEILPAFIALICFSLMASGVYIFNDLMDVDYDKMHPRKKLRPLANGCVEKSHAILLMLLLIVSAFTLALMLPLNVIFTMVVYLLLNIAYSIKLKHIAVIDIFIIAIGFVLRLIVGAQATGVYLSMWIVIMTFLLALFLALSKRRDDVLLASNGCTPRKNIDGYNLEFVNASMVVMSAVIIVSYILYTISAEVMQRIGSPYLYLTTIFVIFGVMRYMQITFVSGLSASPTRILLKDKILQLTIILWLLSFFVISQL